MFIIYRRENNADAEIEILDNASNKEDAILKMLTIAKKKNVEGKSFIVEKEKTIQEFKQVTTVIENGWWPLSDLKTLVNSELVAVYGIFQIPTPMIKKRKQPSLYDKDEIIELLLTAVNTSVNVNNERAAKIYASLVKMTKEDREEIFRWCEERRTFSNILNVMGCIRELEGDNVGRYEYLLQSAEKGDILGMRNLAIYFDKFNKAEPAISWYTKAINLGDDQSMKMLADMYARMGITKVNKENARYWNIKYQESLAL
jgi:hypothetical protein